MAAHESAKSQKKITAARPGKEKNRIPPPLSRHFADGRVLHLRATCSRYLLGGSAAPTGATVDAVLAAPLTTGPTDNCMGPDFRSA